MFGKNINEWLLMSKEKPEAYDFTKEIVSFTDLEEDAIDRYVIYQATGIREGKQAFCEAQSILEGYKVFNWKDDADGCDLVEKIYGILWSNHILIHCKRGRWITGETMNSVNTTMRELLKKEMNDGNWGIAKTVKCYAEKKDNIKDLLKIYSSAEKFLEVVYTIGNFIPVPVGCNAPRGYNNHDIEDYWDKTLWFIYRWYQSPSKVNLKKIVKFNRNVSRYENWLKAFGSWDQFVVANFMQDFVRKSGSNDQGVFGEPKELWEDHLKEDTSVLPKPEQLDEFFKNVTACISARSVRMVNALRTNGGI